MKHGYTKKSLKYGAVPSLIFTLSLMINFEKTNAVGNTIDYREEMRNFVIRLSSLGKKARPDFIVIPQNALETLTVNGEFDGEPAKGYLSAIDGIGCEELFYGLPKDGIPTQATTTEYLLAFFKLGNRAGKPVLVIDYTRGDEQAGRSYALSKQNGFISFQAERSLSEIPDTIHDVNDNDIGRLADAKNFLYIINTSKFSTVDRFLKTLNKTNWDVLIIDLFFHGRPLLNHQVSSLKKKSNGKKRLVISYLSIGEAEDYRYYWEKSWKRNPPDFIEGENPEWKGNYKVRYWMKEWKKIIYGNGQGQTSNGSYLKKIIDAGFDGVYLDIIDAADFFEKKR